MGLVKARRSLCPFPFWLSNLLVIHFNIQIFKMPVERKERSENVMSKSFSRMTNRLDGGEREFLWGVNLTKETAEQNWDFEEEDDDIDYCTHTLLLKSAVLGKDAKEGERNIVEAVTKNFDGKELVVPILSLTLGRNDMCPLDLTFTEVFPVKFRLAEGSGPVHLVGSDCVDYPEDPDADADATEVELTEDETEVTEGDTEGEEVAAAKKGSKRKGGKQGGKGKQKGRMDSSAASTGEDEVDDDDDEDDDEEEEDMEEDDDDAEYEEGHVIRRGLSILQDPTDEDEEEDEEEEDDDEESEEVESSPEKPAPKKKASKGKAKNSSPAKSKSPKKAAKPAKKASTKKGKK